MFADVATILRRFLDKFHDNFSFTDNLIMFQIKCVFSDKINQCYFRQPIAHA